VADDKKSNETRKGEEKQSKFHYNPGNMSGKTVEICKEESEQQGNADRIKSRHQQQDKKG